MNVKNAVKVAIEYIAEIFESEEAKNIGLEEVSLNESENMWEVTIGFSRKWDYPESGGVLTELMRNQFPNRQYKVVMIDSKTGEVKAIKIRETKNA